MEQKVDRQGVFSRFYFCTERKCRVLLSSEQMVDTWRRKYRISDIRTPSLTLPESVCELYTTYSSLAECATV
jgi:hypothetical protein